MVDETDFAFLVGGQDIDEVGIFQATAGGALYELQLGLGHLHRLVLFERLISLHRAKRSGKLHGLLGLKKFLGHGHEVFFFQLVAHAHFEERRIGHNHDLGGALLVQLARLDDVLGGEERERREREEESEEVIHVVIMLGNRFEGHHVAWLLRSGGDLIKRCGISRSYGILKTTRFGGALVSTGD